MHRRLLGTQKLRRYIVNENVVVHSDHEPLHWLLTIDKHSGHLMRWRLCFFVFDLEVPYKKGKANTKADSMSRLNTDGEAIPDDKDDIQEFSVAEDNSSKDDRIYFLDEENDDDLADPEYAEVDQLITVMIYYAPLHSYAN